MDDRYVIAMDWIEGTDLEALLDAEGRPGLDPALAIGYLEQAAEALEHLHTHDPPVVHGDVKPANLILTSSGRIVARRLRTVLHARRRPAPGGHGRLRGARGRGGGEADRGVGRVLVRRHRARRCSPASLPPAARRAGARSSAERIPALERIVRANLATDPARRDRVGGRLRRQAAALVGRRPPDGNGHARAGRPGHRPHGTPRRRWTRSPARTAATASSPVDDGPLLAAFASAQDGLDAARELAGRFDARVAAVTGEAEPRAGSYRGEPASAAARLLELADRGQVVVDDCDSPRRSTASFRRSSASPSCPGAARGRAGRSSRPGCRSRRAPTPARTAGCMAFQPEDGDLFFGREEVVAAHPRAAPRRRLHGRGRSVGEREVVPRPRRPRPGVPPSARRRRRGDDAGRGSRGRAEPRGRIAPPVAARRRPAGGGVHALSGRSGPGPLLRRADGPARGGLHLARRRPPRGLLRTLRRASSPRRGAGRAPAPARADADATSFAARSRVPRARRGSASRPAWSTRCWPTSRASPAPSRCSPTPSTSRGPAATAASSRGRATVAAGGVRGAIAHTAEEVFLGCSEEEQALMRRMFLRLTELGESTEDTRRRVPLAELIPEGEGGGEATAVLERLAGSRLLVVGDDSAEIAHEALIREWPRLRGWLAEDRDELRALRQLTTAARSWDETGRDDADLYRGPRLAAAVELAGDERQLSRVERDFLDASRDAQDRELDERRRRARRLRALLAGVAAALVAAVIAGAFALVQRGSARRSAIVAQAGRLAAQSREVAAAASGPRAPPRARGGPPRRLGRHPRRAPGRARARLADPRVAPGVRLARQRHGVQPGRQAPGDRDARRHDALGHGDMAARRPAAALVAGRLGGRRLQPRRADARDRGRRGPRRAVGRRRADVGSASSTESREPGDRALRGPRTALTAPSSRPVGRRTTTSRSGTPRAAACIGRPIMTNPPRSGARTRSPSARTRSGSPSRALPEPSGSGRSPRAAGSDEPLAIGSAHVEAAIFADGGRTLIASDDSGSVSMVDVATGRPIGRPLSVGDEPAGSLDLSPDGRLLAAASFDGSVFVWDAKTGAPYGSPLTADTSPVNDVAFSPDGRTLVSSHLRSAVVWNMSGEQAIGRAAGRADGPDHRRGLQPRRQAARRRAVRRRRDRVRRRDASTGAPDRRRLGRHRGRVPPRREPPRGRNDRREGAALRCEEREGRRSDPLDARDAAVWQVAFSPDGRLLAVAVDPNGVDGFYGQQRQGEVQLWDVRLPAAAWGGRSCRARGSVLSVAFSRDGTLLATGSYGGQLDLWDVATRARRGKPMRVADDGVLSVAFDPSGRLVAGGGATGPVRVWRVADQRPAFPPLSGHTGPVTGAAFDPTGSFLATTSAVRRDQAVGPRHGPRLRRRAGRKPEARLARRRRSTCRSWGCGTRSARTASCWPTAGVETRAMLWDVDPAVWRRRACAIVGRNLSPRGVEALPPVGDAVSRDLPGVADRLDGRSAGPTLAERSETVPFAQLNPVGRSDGFGRLGAPPLLGDRATSASVEPKEGSS